MLQSSVSTATLGSDMMEDRLLPSSSSTAEIGSDMMEDSAVVIIGLHSHTWFGHNGSQWASTATLDSDMTKDIMITSSTLGTTLSSDIMAQRAVVITIPTPAHPPTIALD